jgi:hypothetical protein
VGLMVRTHTKRILLGLGDDTQWISSPNAIKTASALIVHEPRSIKQGKSALVLGVNRLPYCPTCGTELKPNEKFCTNCGSPVEPSPATKSPSTPWHIRRNIAALVLVVALVGVLLAALSPSPSQTATTTQGTTIVSSTFPSTSGELAVQLGQPFVINGSETNNIPVQLTLTGMWFATDYEYVHADAGYKVFVISMEAKNLGTRETSVPTLGTEVTVDKGYIYGASYDPFVGPDKGSLRPTEVKDDAVAFSILATTTPVKVTFTPLFWETPLFVFYVSGNITTSTSSSTSLTSQVELFQIIRSKAV